MLLQAPPTAAAAAAGGPGGGADDDDDDQLMINCTMLMHGHLCHSSRSPSGNVTPPNTNGETAGGDGRQQNNIMVLVISSDENPWRQNVL